VEADERVCPECGSPVGRRQPLCDHCGANLTRVPRLPTRRAWEARQAAPLPGPRPARPRRAGRGLIVAGFVLAALSLVLGLLAAVPAIVIGVVVIMHGRTGLGVAIITTAVVCALTLAITVLGVLDGRTFRIPSESMAPTLKVEDRIFTTKVSTPERGDVIVFEAPAGALENRCGVEPVPTRAPCAQPTEERSDQTFVARVVGEPGDRLKVIEGRAYIDGVRQDEPFINEETDLNCEICNLPSEITIPPDHYFVMGDNRGASADSREYGPIPEDSVVGEVRLRYWPLGDFGSP
jgi:signal peptidase I